MTIATSTPVTGYFLLAWFLGFAGTIDVVLQPRQAFIDSGHSKLKWLGIELAGGIFLLGPFTWGYYALKIRRELLQHGGRKPRKWTHFWLEMWGTAFGNTTSYGAGSGGSSDVYKPPRGSCDAGCINGKAICPKCKGSTTITDPNGHLIQCTMCYGSRTQGICHRCKGTGQLA